jgi:small-conductance mechanosensitive channel
MTGIEMIVPNEMLVGSVIANETFSDPKIRIAVQVQVAYGADLERAMALLVAAAQAQSRVLADPLPTAIVVACADCGINLELGFWIDDPELGTGQVKSDILQAILKSFRIAGIEIPYPQREVRML